MPIYKQYICDTVDSIIIIIKNIPCLKMCEILNSTFNELFYSYDIDYGINLSLHIST